MIASVFLALACVVFLGTLVTYLFPQIQIDKFRSNINQLVLYIFLPALNFKVIYEATIGHEFWQLPLLSFLGVVAAVVVGVVTYSFIKVSSKTKAALILAGAFSNVTYFGIAVLQGLFPANAMDVLKVAILFEITVTPLNIVLGSALAVFFMKKEEDFSIRKPLFEILKLPILWTSFLALILNFAKIPVPDFLLQAVTLLASAVSGLMIFSLGLALKYPVLARSMKRFHVLLPVIVIKLILSPFLMYWGVKWLGVVKPYSGASVIEAAMPTQLLTLIVADRYDLDSEILAVMIALDTALAFATIPIMHFILNRVIL